MVTPWIYQIEKYLCSSYIENPQLVLDEHENAASDSTMLKINTDTTCVTLVQSSQRKVRGGI